ncbi:citrate/2-methylcitrate synthase [Oscillospiraceae bacterium HV4-5-C5C]|nr:citrate/2-methylcitrate synthase [Oscillospiraceae bacterium HV4-5-C5C]
MNDQESKTAELYQHAKTRRQIPPELFERYGVKRGLRNDNGTGVLAGLTEIGEVYSYIMDDGERVPCEGHLFYHGIDVEDLVHGFYDEKRFGFEETTYLLLFGELPTQKELDVFNASLSCNRDLPENFLEDLILKHPSRDIMNKMARSVLNLYASDDNADDISPENVFIQCVRLIARFPALAAYGYMAKSHYIDKKSLFIHAPRPEYNTAENLLYLIRPDGQFTELEARVLDLALVLHADHGGGNNSTFVTRAVTSTGTDTYSAIAAALGSLKGPQHGGASGKAYAMMQDLKANVSNWRSEDELSDYLTRLLTKQAFDRSGLIYGIGHAVYTLSDPRAKLLRDYARQLAYVNHMDDEYQLYLDVERLAPAVFNNVKNNDKQVCANVDFFSGFVYKMLGIPEELYSPIFAVARISGWSAHRLEELISGGRIMRPAYKSIARRRAYTPMENRLGSEKA